VASEAGGSAGGDAPSVPPALAALDSAQPGPSIDTGTGGPVDAIPLPSGSEFNRPPPEAAPVVPGTDDAVSVISPPAPTALVPDAPGGLDTAPAPQPDIAVAPEASQPGSLDAGEVTVSDATAEDEAGPDPTPPAALATIARDRAAEADVESAAPPAQGVQDEPAPDVAEAAPEPETAEIAESPAPVETAREPEATDAPDVVLAEDAEPVPDTEETVAEAPIGEPDLAPEAQPVDVAEADAGSSAAEDDTPTRPSAPPAVVQLVPPQESAPLIAAPMDDLPSAEMDATGDTSLPEPPRLLRPSEGEGATAGARTLPQIVSPARNVPDDSDAGSDLPVAEFDTTIEAPARSDLPAIEAFAAPFDGGETRPLMAVVLFDEPDDRLDIETLTRFSFPVAFAIDPSRPDAAERAAIYREAGFEVLMIASVIPEGATASDTEVALSAARERVPEAIALIDTPEGRVQSDRAVLEAAVGAAAGEGQGFVAFPRGLNTAEQTAERAGVPAATLFRLLDDEDQRATVITRFLGRAEFAAQQEGAVIVAGRTRPDTVTALFSWALGDRNEGVAIAPVSAVLQRLAEE
jgi:polysaccharide deacetylase 2 family uncharacterized protein YibQ